MNPYASYLGDRDPLGVIAETPARLAAFAAQLGPEGLKRSPAPGKWSAAAILCHLADCELVFAYRLRQALTQEHHVIQPFDQDAWAAPYESLDPAAALAVFTATRRWNLALFGRLTSAEMQKRLTHPERGEMTVRTVLETIGGHDLNHLGQIERIAAGSAAAAR